MGYHQDVGSAARWLSSIQNEDNGWGLTANQGSSLVNTAEALFVLDQAGEFYDERERGIEYIIRSLFSHLEDPRRGARTRYMAFSLPALCDHSQLVQTRFIERCVEWLLSARNPDSAWGPESRDGQSALFPTFQATIALQKAGVPPSELKTTYQWILAQCSRSGWALHPGSQPTQVATAYAVLSLVNSSFRSHDQIAAAHSFLSQTKHWGPHEEVHAGTVWKHCTFAWVIPALLSLDEDPYSPAIAEGIRFINTVRAREGGWVETLGPQGKTVRAQYWATVALNATHKAFDPAIHSLRIDAERSEEVLLEPEFVKIRMNSTWATILPSKAYRLLAFSLYAAALFFLFGIHRALPRLPVRADSVIAILCIVLAAFLMKRRRRYFPESIKYLDRSIAGIAALNLIFGITINDVFQKIIELLRFWE